MRAGMRFLGSLATVLALGLTVSAGASATTLTLKTAAGPLAKGAPLVLESYNLFWSTTLGNQECPIDRWSGTLKTNAAKKDKWSVESGVREGDEHGLCAEREWHWLRFPWEGELSSAGVLTIKNATEHVAFEDSFGEAGGPKCVYESPKVTGEFSTSGSLLVAMNNQLFTEDTKVSGGCESKEGTMSGTWHAFSNGEEVEVEVK